MASVFGASLKLSALAESQSLTIGGNSVGINATPYLSATLPTSSLKAYKVPCGVTFDAATTTGQTFRLNHTFPGYLHVGNPHIAVLVEARLRDKTGSATAQPTLNLTAQAFWNSAGVDTSAQTLASAATFGQLNSTSTVLGATDYTDSQTEGFAWYIADITAAMSAAQRLALKTNLEGNSKPLGMQFVIAPSATVGANLAIDVKSIVLQYRRHQGLRRITDRP